MSNVPSKRITPIGYRESWRTNADIEEFLTATLDNYGNTTDLWMETEQQNNNLVETTLHYEDAQIRHTERRGGRPNEIEFLYKGQVNRAAMAQKEGYENSTRQPFM